MTVNLSPTVRLAIYIIGSVGSLVAGYLFTKGVIGREEVALWGGFVALGFGLAGLNTPTGTRNQRGQTNAVMLLVVVLLVVLILVAAGLL